MPVTAANTNKSTLVQIMNEVDEFSAEEKDFILYWLRSKKNSAMAKDSNDSVLPNNISLDDIYSEKNTMRQETKTQ